MQSRPSFPLATTAASPFAQVQPATALRSAALASWRYPGGRAPSPSVVPAAATKHHRMPAVSPLRAKPRSAGLSCRTLAEAQQVRGQTATLRHGTGFSGACQWQLRAQNATAATCIARQHNQSASAPRSPAISALKHAHTVGPQWPQSTTFCPDGLAPEDLVVSPWLAVRLQGVDNASTAGISNVHRGPAVVRTPLAPLDTNAGLSIGQQQQPVHQTRPGRRRNEVQLRLDVDPCCEYVTVHERVTYCCPLCCHLSGRGCCNNLAAD